jgi:hypothetical protein
VLAAEGGCGTTWGDKMADPYKFLSSVGQAHLLNVISVLFNYDEDLIHFFFSHKEPVLRLPARCLVEEAAKFPLNDQLLIRVALDYWNRRGAARLADMLTDWDHDYWVRFLHSVILLEECKDDLVDRLKTGVPRKKS